MRRIFDVFLSYSDQSQVSLPVPTHFPDPVNSPGASSCEWQLQNLNNKAGQVQVIWKSPYPFPEGNHGQQKERHSQSRKQQAKTKTFLRRPTDIKTPLKRRAGGDTRGRTHSLPCLPTFPSQSGAHFRDRASQLAADAAAVNANRAAYERLRQRRPRTASSTAIVPVVAAAIRRANDDRRRRHR